MDTVREVTRDVLRALGVTEVFGNPGSTELPFLREFPEDFTYVLGLQESVAVGMADGYAQGTGRAALVNLHTAPGLGNAMGAIVTAWHNKSPLVVTAGQQDRRHLALEPLLSGSLVELARPYVKWSHEPARAEDVPAAVERAYHTAMQAPRGPVFLSVPMDDWEARVPAHEVRRVSYRSAPDPRELDRVVERLRGSRRPALVAGAGLGESEGWNAAVDLAERLGAEVWAAPEASRAGFPQDHALFRGHLEGAQAPLGEQLSGYDAVLVAGAPVFTYYPYVPGPIAGAETAVVQLTDDPAEAARSAAGESVVGDVALAVRYLAENLPGPGPELPPAPVRPEVPDPGVPLPVGYVLGELARILPEEAILVDESPSSQAEIYAHLPVTRPGGYYVAGSGGLGFGMPAAVGLQLASPERSVVCLVGDGSSLYAMQALWSAARCRASVTFVVMNNGQYTILKSFRDSLGAGGVPGLDLPGLDLVRVAGGLGCEAETVEEPDGLRGALDRAVRDHRPRLVNVLVDPAVPGLLG